MMIEYVEHDAYDGDDNDVEDYDYDKNDDVTFIWMILMKMIDMRMAMMHMRM